MHDITITPVHTKQQLKQYIYLPEKLHRNNPNWIPPIYLDEWDYYNPKKNNYLNTCPHQLFLAEDKNGNIIGRILGVYPKNYNQKHQINELRFSYLEAFNEDIRTAQSLIEAVLLWGKGFDCHSLVGPVAFNDKDPQGYQIDGFEHLSVTATHSSLPERIELLNKLGFTKKIDLWVYKIPVRDKIPELHHKIAERSRRNNPELKLIQIKNKWQLRDLIVPIFNLVNKTFNDIYAFSPLQEREMRELSYKYLPVLDKRFVKAIENSEGEIIAFVLAMPNMSKGIIKSKGRIIPWGLLKIWASQKKTKQLDMLLGAVHPEYQNKGLDAQLAQALFKEARDAGFEFLDSHLELETNTKMHAENIKLGGEIYKKYRIFQKSI